MAKQKIETFLGTELIDFLKTVSTNRSEAIRICIQEYKKIKESEAK